MEKTVMTTIFAMLVGRHLNLCIGLCAQADANKGCKSQPEMTNA